MVWALRLAGEWLHLLRDGVEERRRSLAAPAPAASTGQPAKPQGDLAACRDWASRYEAAVKADSFDTLLTLGREISAWLGASDWMPLITADTGAIEFDIETDAAPGDGPRAFLDVPWELLTDAQGFLALDAARPFCVQRRLGRRGTLAQATRKDLFLMFMAASPRNVEPVLDYEGEEAGILKATEQLPLTLAVEESGCLDFLRNRLSDEGPFDALHLSCHGTIVKGEPLLMLESPQGGRADAPASALIAACGKDKPALIVLSACRTAEHGAQSASLAASLLRSGVPAVLGWDGSVFDTDAIHFARVFYAELARHQTPAYAAAMAREAMLAAHLGDPDRKACRHWHLARLYVNAAGGAPICKQGGTPRPGNRGEAERAFLDKERQRIPVAKPTGFVGRRREAQDILGVFRDRSHAGVLIHGFGGQGKSSLAARIADRMPRHKAVVVFGQYDAKAIFDAALQAVPAPGRGPLRERYAADIDKENMLADALEEILTGPCAARSMLGLI